MNHECRVLIDNLTLSHEKKKKSACRVSYLDKKNDRNRTPITGYIVV